MRISRGGQRFDGVASFGRRPTFDNGAPLLEVFLFDFKGDLYGATLDVAFIAFIREELKFDSIDALVRRMDDDSAQARAALTAAPGRLSEAREDRLKTEKQKMLGGRTISPRCRARRRTGGCQNLDGALQRRAGPRHHLNAHALLSERLGHVGRDVVIRPPFFCDYGYNIRVGDGVFLNFNCVILDVVEVTIGDRTQIGPAVQIYAADHPRDPETRSKGLEFGRPVRIGCDVWIGGGAIILPWGHRRRRGGDRRRQRGDPGRRKRRDRDGESGPAAAELTTFRPLRFSLRPAMESPMFVRRTIRITSPASA